VPIGILFLGSGFNSEAGYSGELERPEMLVEDSPAGDLDIPVGNFAFFPADCKGNFLLNSKAALAQVSKSSNTRWSSNCES
jgi:hypothetical protein